MDFFLEQNPEDNEGWNILNGGSVIVDSENRNKFMMLRLRDFSNELQKKIMFVYTNRILEEQLLVLSAMIF